MAERAKILLVDIETAPAKALVWGNRKYEQDVIEFLEPWYLLSFSYKWLGEKKAHCHTIDETPASPAYNDKNLIIKLHSLFDEATHVVAHNAKFDIGKTAARAMMHGLPKWSPFEVICTYRIAKSVGGFSSFKLDDLAAELGVGRKLPHQGKHTWLGAMARDPKAISTLKKYNLHDVDPLLEGVFLKFRPWCTTFPHLTNYSRDEACPRCQSKNIEYRGWHVTKTGRRRRIHCLADGCHAWSIDKTFIRDEAA